MKKSQKLKLNYQRSIVKGQLLRKRGFSLMELMVVMAIIAIMTVAVFANKNSNKATSDVEVVTRQVAAQIRALQNEALNGKLIEGVIVCQYNFNAWNSVYTVSYGDCTTNATIASGTQTVDLTKKKVSFDGAAVNLYFSSPRGNVDAKKTIVLKSTIDPTVKRWVCVSSDGVVTEQKTVCP